MEDVASGLRGAHPLIYCLDTRIARVLNLYEPFRIIRQRRIRAIQPIGGRTSKLEEIENRDWLNTRRSRCSAGFSRTTRVHPGVPMCSLKTHERNRASRCSINLHGQLSRGTRTRAFNHLGYHQNRGIPCMIASRLRGSRRGSRENGGILSRGENFHSPPGEYIREITRARHREISYPPAGSERS